MAGVGAVGEEAPASLLVPELAGFWRAARDRVERRDGPARGRLAVGALAAPARLALEAVLDRPVRATVELAALEAALARLGLGDTLGDALTKLGHAPAPEAAQRRAARRAAGEAHGAARLEVQRWPEPWASEWVDGVIRAGMVRGFAAAEAVRFVGDVRRALDRLDEHAGAGAAGGVVVARSRTDLAAELFGDAHALDTGTRLEAALTRALARRHDGVARRELWEQAGAPLDLTSAPALVWNLPLEAGEGLGMLVVRAAALGLPVHLSLLALRRHPVRPRPGADVLVVENPRVVEAAAQRGFDGALVCGAGNPSSAVQVLVAQLLAGGATVRYHGDFDTAGLAICGRFRAAGAIPWRMGAADYDAAVADAAEAGVELPVDERRVPPTPWSPPLRVAFERHRRVVHEERLLDQLLG